MVFKLNRTTSNSKAKLIEHKLEYIFAQRKQLVLTTIKKYSKYISSRTVVAKKMMETLHQLFMRKYNLYNIFYMMKNTTKYQTGRYNHLKLAVFNLDRVLSKTLRTVLKTYYAQISANYLKETLKFRKLKLDLAQSQGDHFVKIPKFKNTSGRSPELAQVTSHHELPAISVPAARPYEQKIKYNTNNNLESETLEVSSPQLLKKARKLTTAAALNQFRFAPLPAGENEC